MNTKDKTSVDEIARQAPKLSAIWLLCKEVEKLTIFCDLHGMKAEADVSGGSINFKAYLPKGELIKCLDS